jgi:hypothetical protein
MFHDEWSTRSTRKDELKRENPIGTVKNRNNGIFISTAEINNGYRSDSGDISLIVSSMPTGSAYVDYTVHWFSYTFEPI